MSSQCHAPLNKFEDDLAYDLFHLFNVVLGAAISFLPAIYLLVLPRVSMLKMNVASFTVTWAFVAVALLWEYWKAALFNWRHGMEFKRPMKTLYLMAASAYVFTLVIMPASLAFQAFLPHETSFKASGVTQLNELGSSFTTMGTYDLVDPDLAIHEVLAPLVFVLIALEAFSAICTFTKLWNTQFPASSWHYPYVLIDFLYSVMVILIYVLWLFFSQDATTWGAVISLIATYLVADVLLFLKMRQIRNNHAPKDQPLEVAPQ